MVGVAMVLMVDMWWAHLCIIFTLFTLPWCYYRGHSDLSEGASLHVEDPPTLPLLQRSQEDDHCVFHEPAFRSLHGYGQGGTRDSS